jgi:hypothetical protein
MVQATTGDNRVNFPFVTGSWAYGIPHAESDLDLVIYLPHSSPDYDLLQLLKDSVHNPDHVSADHSVRFGGKTGINIIVANTLPEFALWKAGTEYLKIVGPVLHNEANAYFDSLRFPKTKPYHSKSFERDRPKPEWRRKALELFEQRGRKSLPKYSGHAALDIWVREHFTASETIDSSLPDFG